MQIQTPHEWLASKFGQYYQRAQVKPSIRQIEKREFGFGGWEKKIEFRHMAFGSEAALSARLVQERPLFVSCSAAYYELPDGRPMSRKGWLGADLIFDLDAEAHSCAPFTCDACFDKIKTQTMRLIEEFLLPDFGLSENELQLNFSGSRGYHVRVFKEEFFPLGREERREIVDYIQGTGLSYEALFKAEERHVDLGSGKASVLKKLSGPTSSAGGYGGKFAREMVKIANEPEKAAALISPKLKKPEEAARFVKGIAEGDWSRVKISNQDVKFRSIFDSLKVRLSDQVDANVTCDTGKILRVPDSIHGGSGLLAKTISKRTLGGFDPTRGAACFSQKVAEKIRFTQEVPPIVWDGEVAEGRKKDAVAELPEALAVYYVCKRAAVPA